MTDKLTTDRLLAIDPGGTTGLCLWEGGAWLQGETKFEDTCRYVKAVLDEGNVTVVMERLVISQRTIELGRDHNAIELTGVCRWLCLERDIPEPLLASPADAKRLVTDARLKALGCWHKGGGGHANDAARHAVLWLVKFGAIRLPV